MIRDLLTRIECTFNGDDGFRVPQYGYLYNVVLLKATFARVVAMELRESGGSGVVNHSEIGKWVNRMLANRRWAKNPEREVQLLVVKDDDSLLLQRNDCTVMIFTDAERVLVEVNPCIMYQPV